MPDKKTDIKNSYPLPIFNYKVTIYKDDDANVIGFSEVDGLSVEYESVTYKHGLSFVMGSKIIPGQRQAINITMKRGIVKNGDFLQKWIDGVYSDPFYGSAKRDIVIDLCDETGAAVVRWKVSRALPVKMEAPGFDASSNDVAIESFEVVAHSLSVDYHP